ncbi:insulin-like growth factor 1 receptor [Argopecten irradians]|uniref:insulin-like growth factor 1 receptor n=1 Tax=Argopecten irradians TaxID=31199 RepID=UPI00371F5FB4
MTRTLIESDYYRFTKKGMLPVRWMSPESLWDGMFTSKSDIWSFGILVFEIVTFGSFPYQGLSNNQVLEFVKKGNRLILPGNCPEDLCDFIHSCLSYEASDRPDIEDIFDKLIKDPMFIQPCLDAPTTSIVIEDMESVELVNASCQNTITKSHSVLPTLLNRLSQTSQDVKRLSAGSQGNKLSTPTKISIKTFVPSIFTRSRSNSLDLVTQSPCKKDLYNQFEEIQDRESPDDSEAAVKSNQNSHEIHGDSGYNHYPLLSPGERGDTTSDYFSDKDQLTVLEMCETVTSV